MRKINFKALLNDSKSVSLSTKRKLGIYFRLGEELANSYVKEITDFETEMEIINKCHEFDIASNAVNYEVEYNKILSPTGRIIYENFAAMESSLRTKVEEYDEKLRHDEKLRQEEVKKYYIK